MTATLPDGPPHIRLEIVSDPIYLSGAREMITNIASRLGFDDLECCKLALALDEALTNIIRHGYDNRPDRPIWISLWPIGDTSKTHPGLRIMVEDDAPVVDVSSIQGRDLDEVRPGGLGVHIIREIMDEVVYEPRGERGMRLLMTKHAGKTNPPGSADAPRTPGDAPTPSATDDSARTAAQVRYGTRRGH